MSHAGWNRPEPGFRLLNRHLILLVLILLATTGVISFPPSTNIPKISTAIIGSANNSDADSTSSTVVTKDLRKDDKRGYVPHTFFYAKPLFVLCPYAEAVITDHMAEWLTDSNHWKVRFFEEHGLADRVNHWRIVASIINKPQDKIDLDNPTTMSRLRLELATALLKCMDCACKEENDGIITSNEFPPGMTEVQRKWAKGRGRRCYEQAIADECLTMFGCYCSTQLAAKARPKWNKETQDWIPRGQGIEDYEAALRRIPPFIRNAAHNQNFVWNPHAELGEDEERTLALADYPYVGNDPSGVEGVNVAPPNEPPFYLEGQAQPPLEMNQMDPDVLFAMDPAELAMQQARAQHEYENTYRGLGVFAVNENFFPPDPAPLDPNNPQQPPFDPNNPQQPPFDPNNPQQPPFDPNNPHPPFDPNNPYPPYDPNDPLQPPFDPNAPWPHVGDEMGLLDPTEMGGPLPPGQEQLHPTEGNPLNFFAPWDGSGFLPPSNFDKHGRGGWMKRDVPVEPVPAVVEVGAG
ncbi:hypothetical protein TWF730_002006 [Orbilia blumenaviensis]|uniref:Uncharacterized protein n=1 Tax=Orbilia blumenaviensis TaxID=1796055 RepID=A0AAV9UGR5_9PEZI